MPRNCKHVFEWQGNCGKVCWKCDQHDGLARCFCGWATNGGDGRDQLRELGENLDDDY